MHIVSILPCSDYVNTNRVEITYDDGVSITITDDGSFDGHPAWGVLPGKR